MTRSGTAAPDRRRTLRAGVLGGIGLMVGADQVVFHQLLGWHHLYDGSTRRIGVLADGLLHTAELAVLVTGLLLLVWLAVTVIGWVVEGLFWLTVVGLGLFLVTAALGMRKRIRS